MIRQLLHPEIPAFQNYEWTLEDIHSTLFKCTRWQLEQTMDPINCPYHYYCDSTYPPPGNYPPLVDVLVLSFMTASYLATLTSIVMEISSYKASPPRTTTFLVRLRRSLLPSGPLSLPLTLLILAKGHRINTVFPISCIGPSILQLIQISALALEDAAAAEMDIIKYGFYKASTISGILHASLYLDSTILPYYTGFDALVSSTFSGECISCVCRKEVLVVGGKLVSYRGWSLTTILVVGTLSSRIISRLQPTENKGKNILLIKTMFETLGWIFIAWDSAYLITNSPPERTPLRVTASSGLFVLICLHVIRKACTWLKQHT